MTLFELRSLFVKWSGRRDLVDEYGYDNGADVFINAGLRMLDRMVSDDVPTDNMVPEEEDDEVFWTLNHPDIAVKAALQRLEVSYRNMAGANDWMASLIQDLQELGMDILEETVAGINEMEG